MMISTQVVQEFYAAESGGAELLYTEDLNDGQNYGPVTARNPFHRAGTGSG